MRCFTILFTIAHTFLFSIAGAQIIAPQIEWQKTIGGSFDELLFSIQQTTDGGYILGGYSFSAISGDKTEASLGERDYWVVKLDSSNSVEWQNTIGGSGEDFLSSLQQTTDGGYILGGFSYSGISGDKTEDTLGGTDFWIVKLDSSGAIEWQNTIGGSDHDDLFSIQQTADEGYILGGFSKSGISGDKTENNMGPYDTNDFWVVKLNSSGVIEWQNTIGGSDYDDLFSIQQTTDGGYILGGYSKSGISGDKTEDKIGPLETYDYWVVKLNSAGIIEWENTIGGDKGDWLHTIQQTADGGYILGGYSHSGISGDKTENHIGQSNTFDYWVIKLDNSGVIEWQNTIGGNKDDYVVSILQTTDGGYILGGSSFSGISGDKSESNIGPLSTYDYWVVKLENSGAIQWQKTIGGIASDWLSSIQQTSDGGYILGGYSYSGVSGDKTEASQGYGDYWVVKLYPEVCNGITVYADTDGDAYGDAANSYFAADCLIPGGYVINNVDCNDSNATINPAAAEICNNLDDDCNGTADDGLILVTYYADADDDGYGDASDTGTSLCSDPGVGFSANNTDCNDSNAVINPAAIEICNNLDDNCNGIADDGLNFVTYYADADGDGYGDLFDAGNSLCSDPGVGFSTSNTDCNDSSAAINPATVEICNNLDDNCNGIADDGLIFMMYYADGDSDLYGSPEIATYSCVPVSGYVTDNNDCNDNNPNINPGATEIPNNGIDDDCDGDVDEFPDGISSAISKSVQVSIFPNPAEDFTNIQFTLQFATHILVVVSDITGKKILTLLNKELQSGDHSLPLNTSGFSKGMYLVQVTLDNGIENRKLVVQ